MPTPAEIQQVSDIYISMLRNTEVRRLRGAQLRDEMHEAVERGERPTGYRPDWVRQSAIRIVRELQHIGFDFNDNHQNDQCSVGDLIDILTTALSHLQKKADGK